jgi:tRNA(fMet)-specific endonuclease VapC
MTCLLDTNACIALINGTPREVRRRFQRAIDKEASILASSVVTCELWYGDAREAGMVRAELEIAGQPIDACDVPIAGQARRRGATLVTSNVAEFDRVAGLKWEDWAAACRGRSQKRPPPALSP